MTAASFNLENASPAPENDNTEGPADFERAVSATGYGAFNVLLLLAVIPAGWSGAFDSSTVAFIMATAECDMELTLFRKGALAGITFAGMISSTFLWSFIGNHVGRRSLLLFGLITDFACNMLASTARTYFVLMLSKFLSGTIICGPFATIMTYLGEFHGKDHRARMTMWTGLLFALGNVAIPVLALTILPQPWTFALFNDSLVFNSWRIYLLVCSLPPLLGYMTMYSFPESPKYLMTKGNTEEALKIFRMMYTMNTGEPADTYPITTLRRETQLEGTQSLPSESPWKKTKETWSNAKGLFATSHVVPFIALIFVQFGGMVGLNTVRLWLPQLLTLLGNLNLTGWDSSLESPTVCNLRDIPSTNSPGNVSTGANTIDDTMDVCIPMYVSTTVYVNATIIAAVSTTAYLLAVMVIEPIGKKNVVLTTLLLSGLSSFSMKWVPTTNVLLVLATVIITLTRIATETNVGLIIDTFPTPLRTMAATLTTMVGNSGALIGNLLFPVLLETGCLSPFLFLGCVLVLCSVLSIFLTNPRSTKEPDKAEQE